MSLPSITIITPSLNQKNFIEKTILSVLSQDYPNLEYIVLDGGSTDGTISVLKKYSRHLSWVSEPDRGQSHAINKGFSLATGEVIAFINSDDLYEPGALHTVGRYFETHPAIKWLAGKCRIINQQDREIMRGVTLYKNILLKTGSYRMLLIVNFLSQPAVFMRKETLIEVGMLNESLVYTMDYEYWLRICQRYPIRPLNSYLAQFRTHPTSKTRQSALQSLDEEEKMIQKYNHSTIISKLHQFHRSLNVNAYRTLPG